MLKTSQELLGSERSPQTEPAGLRLAGQAAVSELLG